MRHMLHFIGANNQIKYLVFRKQRICVNLKHYKASLVHIPWLKKIHTEINHTIKLFPAIVIFAAQLKFETAK
jgi:hypothetical protein